MRKNQFQKCIFSVKPIGTLSNKRLVELLDHSADTSEYRDKKCRGRESQNGYEVGAEKLVHVFQSSQDSPELKFQYFVRFKGEDDLNSIQLLPDKDLGSVQSLSKLVGDMLARITVRRRSPLKPTRKVRTRGVFAANVGITTGVGV